MCVSTDANKIKEECLNSKCEISFVGEKNHILSTPSQLLTVNHTLEETSRWSSVSFFTQAATYTFIVNS